MYINICIFFIFFLSTRSYIDRKCIARKTVWSSNSQRNANFTVHVIAYCSRYWQPEGLPRVRWLIDAYRLASTLSDRFLTLIWNLNQPGGQHMMHIDTRAYKHVWPMLLRRIILNSERIDRKFIHRCRYYHYRDVIFEHGGKFQSASSWKAVNSSPAFVAIPPDYEWSAISILISYHHKIFL